MDPQTYQRDPVVVYLPSCFLETWGAKANKPHFFMKILVFGLAAFGGKAKNKYFHEQVCFFGLGTPGLQKNTWQINAVVRVSLVSIVT